MITIYDRSWCNHSISVLKILASLLHTYMYKIHFHFIYNFLIDALDIFPLYNGRQGEILYYLQLCVLYMYICPWYHHENIFYKYHSGSRVIHGTLWSIYWPTHLTTCHQYWVLFFHGTAYDLYMIMPHTKKINQKSSISTDFFFYKYIF